MFRTDVEKAKRKGRAYRCTRCHKVGNEMVDVKYRVADHILKYHLSLDQVPFYFKLCMFRCTEEQQLRQHVTKYKRHLMLTEEKGIVDSSPFLIKNTHPYTVGGADMEALSQEQSMDIFRKRVRPCATVTQPTPEETTEVTGGLDESFDSLEAFVSTLVPPTCPTAVETRSAPRQPDALVQVPADYIASLLRNQSTIASQVPISPPVHVAGQPLAAVQGHNPLDQASQPMSSTPLMDGTPRRILHIPDDPLYPPTRVTSTPTQGTMKSSILPPSTLNTPRVMPCHVNVPSTPLMDERAEEENILPQLLGGMDSTTPILTPQRPSRSVATAATQCCIPEETPAWVGVIQTLAKKMGDNLEANTRTLRVFEKTTMSLRDTLDNLTRLVRKLADDQATKTKPSTDSEDSKKRKSSDGHQLKSVLGKAYPENKKPRY